MSELTDMLRIIAKTTLGSSRKNSPRAKERAAVEQAADVIDRMEFGSYQIIGGKEGDMCPGCYNFKREGHTEECRLRNFYKLWRVP